MFTPLATMKQLRYLQDLADRTEIIRLRHPSLVPQGLTHTTFQYGMTSEKAGLRIQMYRNILDACFAELHPKKEKATDTEDLPE